MTPYMSPQSASKRRLGLKPADKFTLETEEMVDGPKRSKKITVRRKYIVSGIYPFILSAIEVETGWTRSFQYTEIESLVVEINGYAVA